MKLISAKTFSFLLKPAGTGFGHFPFKIVLINKGCREGKLDLFCRIPGTRLWSEDGIYREADFSVT